MSHSEHTPRLCSSRSRLQKGSSWIEDAGWEDWHPVCHSGWEELFQPLAPRIFLQKRLHKPSYRHSLVCTEIFKRECRWFYSHQNENQGMLITQLLVMKYRSVSICVCIFVCEGEKVCACVCVSWNVLGCYSKTWINLLANPVSWKTLRNWRTVTTFKMEDRFNTPSAFVPLRASLPSLNLAAVLTGCDTPKAQGLRADREVSARKTFTEAVCGLALTAKDTLFIGNIWNSLHRAVQQSRTLTGVQSTFP